MRGFPLLRLFLVAIGLALVGVPVWLLTRPVQPAVAMAPSPVEPEKTELYEITLTASSPARLAVRAANQPEVKSDAPVASISASFAMSASTPEDLVVSANFDPPAGNSALRVEVRAAGRIIADSTLWESGSIEDVVKIPTP